MTSLKKYSFFVLIALLVSACANRATFEWIKINPDKIKEANTRVAYRNGIRNIDLMLDLKEKSIPIYYESPEAFETGNSTPLLVKKLEKISKPVIKKSVNLPKITAKKTFVSKPVYNKPVEVKKVVPTKIVSNKTATPKKNISPKVEKKSDSVISDEESIALDKLNGALKIPKKPIKQIIGTQNESSTIPKKVSSKSKIVMSNPLVKPKLAIQQAETEVRPTVEKKNDKVKEFLNARKGNNFILAGAALAVIGVILGLIFGRSAYLVSGAGIVFAAIGFILKA